MVAFFVAFLDENFPNHLKHTYLQQKNMLEKTHFCKSCVPLDAVFLIMYVLLARLSWFGRNNLNHLTCISAHNHWLL